MRSSFAEWPGAGRRAPLAPGFLPVSAAAALLGISPRSVRRWIAAGRLPSTRLGRLHYIPRQALIQAVRQRRPGRGQGRAA
jgi:excisionase family DNA binding protein